MRRRDFLPPSQWVHEAEDAPLGIGFGQTTSQPSLILRMIELLELPPAARVLEIGTGCGYQTALLADRAAEVWSIEIIPELAAMASKHLAALGYTNAHVVVGDGSVGLREHAPYDGIIVSASAPCIPDALVEQLADGARMVIPVEDTLKIVTRRGQATEVRDDWGVRFVPFTGALAELGRS